MTQYSPWTDAAAYGHGLGSALGQIIMQQPQQRYQLRLQQQQMEQIAQQRAAQQAMQQAVAQSQIEWHKAQAQRAMRPPAQKQPLTRFENGQAITQDENGNWVAKDIQGYKPKMAIPNSSLNPYTHPNAAKQYADIAAQGLAAQKGIDPKSIYPDPELPGTIARIIANNQSPQFRLIPNVIPQPPVQQVTPGRFFSEPQTNMIPQPAKTNWMLQAIQQIMQGTNQPPQTTNAVPTFNSEQEARAAGYKSGAKVRIIGMGIGTLD